VPNYVISLEEIMSGGLLLALTMAIHGVGMFVTLRVSDALNERYERSESFAVGLSIIVLASWMIILTNLVEVPLWSAFFVMKEAQSNPSGAFYSALLNYTTLQAGYLPQRWRLLEGLLGMAGLLTLAWSTGILYSLVEGFQKKQLRIRKHKHQSERPVRQDATGHDTRA
jgi:hypothetical protein